MVAQYYALALYGIAIPFVKLMLFLPLVFLAAALPIAVAHLGTSQAAWLLFFSSNATPAKIVAYSLAAQLTFMLCNALIGLVFLPRASRELTHCARSPRPIQLQRRTHCYCGCGDSQTCSKRVGRIGLIT